MMQCMVKLLVSQTNAPSYSSGSRGHGELMQTCGWNKEDCMGYQSHFLTEGFFL